MERDILKRRLDTVCLSASTTLSGTRRHRHPILNAQNVCIAHIIYHRIVPSEEILAKLAALHDIVTGRAANPLFVETAKYNEILKENEMIQQTLYQQNEIIQALTAES